MLAKATAISEGRWGRGFWAQAVAAERFGDQGKPKALLRGTARYRAKSCTGSRHCLPLSSRFHSYPNLCVER